MFVIVDIVFITLHVIFKGVCIALIEWLSFIENCFFPVISLQSASQEFYAAKKLTRMLYLRIIIRNIHFVIVVVVYYVFFLYILLISIVLTQEKAF